MAETSDEDLVEFSFQSCLSDGLAPSDLLTLARRAWRDNVRSGVTGVMRVKGCSVHQTLEGPCAAILALAARILTDERHSRIVVGALAPLSARRYSGWSVEGVAAEPTASAAPQAASFRLVGASAPAANAACDVTALARQA